MLWSTWAESSRMPELHWSARTLVHWVQLSWEDTPAQREIRLVSRSARAGDPVRVKLSGIEVEGRITQVVEGVVYVRIGGRLF